MDKELIKNLIDLLKEAEESINKAKPKIDEGGACLTCTYNKNNMSCNYCQTEIKLFMALHALTKELYKVSQ